ncbi:MAG: transporter [Clostridia bacterium]|nr:transporter [Clostridia bacterium]
MKTSKRTIHTQTMAAAIALLMITASAPTLGETASPFDGHYTTASLSAQEQIAGNLLNSDRMRYSLSPLIIDPVLSSIARIKSEDMRDHHYFSHTSPQYGDVRKMLTQFGYPYEAAGENIAHHATIEKAQAAFLSSPGHRKNILHTGYTKVGIGVAKDHNGHIYLTQIFAR